MKFAIEGKEYQFDPRLTVGEAGFVKDKTGLGVGDFMRGVGLFQTNDLDPYAIGAMMYILKRRAGEAVEWKDMLELNVFSFSMIADEQEKAADEETPKATPRKRSAKSDPTSSSGRTRKPAASST